MTADANRDLLVEIEIVQYFVDRMLDLGCSGPVAIQMSKQQLSAICQFNWDRMKCDPRTGRVAIAETSENRATHYFPVPPNQAKNDGAQHTLAAGEASQRSYSTRPQRQQRGRRVHDEAATHTQ